MILADPPWRFATYSQKGKGRSAEAHYNCLDLAAIKALPVSSWAAESCVLFLWTYGPLLDRAFEVIADWGFEYKGHGFLWAKLNKRASAESFTKADFFMGLGYGTRKNVELCLLATRGEPKRIDKGVRELIIEPEHDPLIIAPRRGHSVKPDEVYGRIERLFPGPHLEMFARRTWPTWDRWGDQVELFDDGPVPTRRGRAMAPA